MRKAVPKLCFVSSCLLVVACHITASGQVERIENKVSDRAPLKLEFKHEDSTDWTHALEITVTNTGEKPIYFLFLNLFPGGVKSPDGVQMGFPMLFGSHRMYSADETPTADDPVVLPQKSVTFKIKTGSADGME